MSNSSVDVVILGSGGFGREVAWALGHPSATVILEEGTEYGVNLLGFLDDDESSHGTVVNGFPVLGGSDWIANRNDVGVLLGIGIPSVKQKVVPRLVELGAMFPTFVDPRAIIGDEVSIGRGVVICAGAIVTCNVVIDDFAMINLSVTVGHDVKIGKFSTISPAANLSGYVEVGEGTDLGTDCTVIPGKKIGKQAVVGAMACVTKDIPDYATAVGIPAKVVKIAAPES